VSIETLENKTSPCTVTRDACVIKFSRLKVSKIDGET